jgi:pimeloyl-ACP methyl ester carboxylesterase
MTTSAWYYLDQGQGPSVVLLHGLGANSFSWRHNLGPLSRHCRVAALDLPAHGRTPGAVVADFRPETLAAGIMALLNSRGISQAVVVGNSLGGSLALLLAHHYPERVAALVLIAPAAASPRVPLIFHPLRLQGLGLIVATVMGPWILPVALRMIYHNRELITPEVVAGYAPTFSTLVHRLALRRLCRETNPWPLNRVKDLLQGIHQPVSLIWGQEDRILPVQQADFLKANLPQAEFHLLPDTGHAPQEESPVTVNEIIIAFLRGSLKN